MQVMLIGLYRIHDIADISAREGALDQTLAIPVIPGGTNCIIDIAYISGIARRLLYTLLKSLALVILHHNHSLLTRYVFLPFILLMSPVCLGRQIEEPKKMKNNKNIFQNSFCRSPKFKDLWKIVFFFLGDPRFPNLWKFVVFCIYEYSKHLVISEMSLSGAKFSEKSICKSMENRTLRDTRSVIKWGNPSQAFMSAQCMSALSSKATKILRTEPNMSRNTL